MLTEYNENIQKAIASFSYRHDLEIEQYENEFGDIMLLVYDLSTHKYIDYCRACIIDAIGTIVKQSNFIGCYTALYKSGYAD